MDTAYYTTPPLPDCTFPRKVVAHHHGQANDYFRTEYRLSVLECGHIEADAEIGATVVCKQCRYQACGIFVLKDVIAKGVFSHTRANADGRDRLIGSMTVYRREPTSPTGVYSVCSVEETPEVLAILGRRPYLSPTEGR
jgi:hypothetical protein